VVDIHGGHLQAAGGNIAHGKVFYLPQKKKTPLVQGKSLSVNKLNGWWD
jgi:hypothetical protein